MTIREPMPKANRRSLRSWIRFRLGSLLLVIAAIAFVAAIHVNRAHRQREVVDWVRGLGGTVRYDYQQPGAAGRWEPKWLRDLLGREYWDRVVGIDLYTTAVCNSDLEHLGKLSDLQFLDLSSTDISDSGVQHLAGLRNLEELSLRDTYVCGEALDSLQALRRLRRLDLGVTEVTDERLQYLSQLSKLAYVAVDGSDVTSEGVRKLNLTLPGCRIHRTGHDFAVWLRSCDSLGDLSEVEFHTAAELEAAIGKPDSITGVTEQVWLYQTRQPNGRMSQANVRVVKTTKNRLRLETPHYSSNASLRESIGSVGSYQGTNLETWRFRIGTEQVLVDVYHDKRTCGVFLLVPESVVLNPHLAN